MKMAMKRVVTTLIIEVCNCYELHIKCTHLNGSVYPRREYLHTLTDYERYIVILESTDTSPEMARHDKATILIDNGDFFELIDSKDLGCFSPLVYFRPGEARIIAQS